MILDFFTSDSDGNSSTRHVDIPDKFMSQEYVNEVLAQHEDAQEGYKAIQDARIAAMVDVTVNT